MALLIACGAAMVAGWLVLAIGGDPS